MPCEKKISVGPFGLQRNHTRIDANEDLVSMPIGEGVKYVYAFVKQVSFNQYFSLQIKSSCKIRVILSSSKKHKNLQKPNIVFYLDFYNQNPISRKEKTSLHVFCCFYISIFV